MGVAEGCGVKVGGSVTVMRWRVVGVAVGSPVET
jgi:hypothetical protein